MQGVRKDGFTYIGRTAQAVLEIANTAAQRLTRKEFLERLTVAFCLTGNDSQEMVPSDGPERTEL